MKTTLFKCLGILAVLLIVLPGAVAAADIGIVFSEVLYDSEDSGDTQGEWLEIYNSTSSAVNVGGWTVRDNTDIFTIPSCTTIAAGGYLVIAQDEIYFYSKYGFYPNIDNSPLRLHNDGDYLTLKDKQGNIKDQVAWESGGSSIAGWCISLLPEANTGKSIIRSDLNQDTGTCADWLSNQTPAPSSNSLPPGSPTISLNPTKLNFSVACGGSTTAQTFSISNSGCGTLNWTVSDNADWLTCSPGSGSGSGVITVSVDPAGLTVGVYNTAITVSSSNASNSPQSVPVTLTLSGECKPKIQLNRTHFYFGVAGEIVTCIPQAFLIDNSGAGTLNWTVTCDAAWLDYSPTSGTGAGQVILSLDSISKALPMGVHTGTVTVIDANASNSPQTISLTLIVHNSDEPPFGEFASPIDGSTVCSGIPVTGWILDDVGVESVTIYRQVESSGENGLAYVGDAVFVEGARPDVEAAYPQYPLNYKAGWGYMMLTNALPPDGNGTYVLEVIARDCGGNEVSLGKKTITVDNISAVKPFGAIDTPIQGGDASGHMYRNQGWALTPMPNILPEDGSTIYVYVDGLNLGTVTYDIVRSDVHKLFPGYLNSDAPGGYFDFDTTPYDNGVHTIAWVAEDNPGNQDGIGSRYFNILNLGVVSHGSLTGNRETRSMMMDFVRAVEIKKGYNRGTELQEIYPDTKGIVDIEIKELERLEIHFASRASAISTLPIGSTLDRERGIFYWQPGPGFLGQYEFAFLIADRSHRRLKKTVRVKIIPLY
ncbi:MAG: lamin tail domain-containing protein [Candidatus Aminicenantes bacterium]|nr:lamin tail domain-containing protein [Candidatus Aminicenantes bacterium]